MRRLIIDPLFVVAVGLSIVSLPLLLLAVAFASRYVPGKWRPLRVVWFFFLYLAVDALAVMALFALWVATGFGWRLQADWSQSTHYRLFGWALRRVVASAEFTFKVRTISDRNLPAPVGSSPRPVLVLSRHAGPGDSMLLMDGIMHRARRRPRIVLKEFFKWDPSVDILLHRIPSAFVPLEQEAGDRVLEAIEDMSATMGSEDAFVIFPEGGNYTLKRHVRAIQKLREIGRLDLAERAEELENTLPPKPKGVMTALASAPEQTDVVFIGHVGLEGLVSPGDLWRSMPIDTQIATKLWYVPSENLPPVEEQETWLYDMWAEIDSWISDKLSDTAEVFDEHDALL